MVLALTIVFIGLCCPSMFMGAVAYSRSYNYYHLSVEVAITSTALQCLKQLAFNLAFNL